MKPEVSLRMLFASECSTVKGMVLVRWLQKLQTFDPFTLPGDSTIVRIMLMRPSRAMCGAVAFVALLAQHSPAQTEPENIEPAELEQMLRQYEPELKLLLLDRVWE